MNGLKMKYFVLKPKGGFNDAYAKASRAAIKAYADAVLAENPNLSHDLHMWVIEEQGAANREDLERRIESGEIKFPKQEE